MQFYKKKKIKDVFHVLWYSLRVSFTSTFSFLRLLFLTNPDSSQVPVFLPFYQKQASWSSGIPNTTLKPDVLFSPVAQLSRWQRAPREQGKIHGLLNLWLMGVLMWQQPPSREIEASSVSIPFVSLSGGLLSTDLWDRPWPFTLADGMWSATTFLSLRLSRFLLSLLIWRCLATVWLICLLT